MDLLYTILSVDDIKPYHELGKARLYKEDRFDGIYSTPIDGLQAVSEVHPVCASGCTSKHWILLMPIQG